MPNDLIVGIDPGTVHQGVSWKNETWGYGSISFLHGWFHRKTTDEFFDQWLRKTRCVSELLSSLAAAAVCHAFIERPDRHIAQKTILDGTFDTKGQRLLRHSRKLWRCWLERQMPVIQVHEVDSLKWQRQLLFDNRPRSWLASSFEEKTKFVASELVGYPVKDSHQADAICLVEYGRHFVVDLQR